MSTTSTQAAPVQARPIQQPGPWDNIQVTLYSGSYDNQGKTITLADARRIVRIGDHELYAKALGGRITVADYTDNIQTKRRAWVKEGYDPKQVKKQFDDRKRVLPAVTWSGLFPMARGVDLISQHSGMIAADVDHLTTKEIEGKWASLTADPHIWFMFLSPSETGIKIILPVSGLMDLWPLVENMTQPEYATVANQFQYAAYFAVRCYMLETHGLQIDGACKDSSRLCYLPFDDKAHSNRHAEPLEVAWSRDVKQQIEEERARECREKAQERERAKMKTKSAPPATMSRSGPALASTEPSPAQASPGDAAPLQSGSPGGVALPSLAQEGKLAAQGAPSTGAGGSKSVRRMAAVGSEPEQDRRGSTASGNGEVSLELLVELLEYIPAVKYDHWLKVNGALKLWGEKTGREEEAFALGDEWSKCCAAKYDAAAQVKLWESLKRRNGEQVATVGTLFYLAKQYGWKPRSPADLRPAGASAEGDPSTIELLAQRRFNGQIEPPPLRPIYKLAGQVVATPGNLATITAAVKTGKSAVVSAMLAASMGATGKDYLGFEAENREGRALLHFDTEQSPDDHWRLVKRALKRGGEEEQPAWLYSYSLAGLGYWAAWQCVCVAVERAAQECGGIHSILIDGVADLVANVNDPEESNRFVSALHDMAIRHDCPAVAVIHFNPGSEKTRGHLGSQLERKAETNLRLDKVDGITVIWSDKQRRAPIPKEQGPRFEWSEAVGMHISTTTLARLKEAREREELEELAAEIFEGAELRTHAELETTVKTRLKVSTSTAERRVKRMVGLGIVVKSGNRYGLR